jgi:hypothetical protein
MSKQLKLWERFKSKPKDFHYERELKPLLVGFGFKENQSGKTSGSGVNFLRKKDLICTVDLKIKFHKPHDSEKVIKRYIIDLIINIIYEHQLEKTLER